MIFLCIGQPMENQLPAVGSQPGSPEISNESQSISGKPSSSSGLNNQSNIKQYITSIYTI